MVLLALDEENGGIIEGFETLLEEYDVLEEHGWYVSSYGFVVGGLRWFMWEKAELEGYEDELESYVVSLVSET